MTEADMVFINALSSAGLLDDLHGQELSEIASSLGSLRGSARRISFLETYYGSAGDESLAHRRCLTDRFFLHRDGDRASGKALVQRLARLCPELPDVVLERIGDETDGALVLRAGDHLAGVVDDYELEMDTDEIDLRTLEEDVPSITVKGLVGAVNVLLQQLGVGRRFVQLRSDLTREAFIAMSRADAEALCEADLLEHTVEDLVEHAAW